MPGRTDGATDVFLAAARTVFGFQARAHGFYMYICACKHGVYFVLQLNEQKKIAKPFCEPENQPLGGGICVNTFLAAEDSILELQPPCCGGSRPFAPTK